MYMQVGNAVAVPVGRALRFDDKQRYKYLSVPIIPIKNHLLVYHILKKKNTF